MKAAPTSTQIIQWASSGAFEDEEADGVGKIEPSTSKRADPIPPEILAASLGPGTWPPNSGARKAAIKRRINEGWNRLMVAAGFTS